MINQWINYAFESETVNEKVEKKIIERRKVNTKNIALKCGKFEGNERIRQKMSSFVNKRKEW